MDTTVPEQGNVFQLKIASSADHYPVSQSRDSLYLSTTSGLVVLAAAARCGLTDFGHLERSRPAKRSCRVSAAAAAPCNVRSEVQVHLLLSDDETPPCGLDFGAAAAATVVRRQDHWNALELVRSDFDDDDAEKEQGEIMVCRTDLSVVTGHIVRHCRKRCCCCTTLMMSSGLAAVDNYSAEGGAERINATVVTI